MKKETVKIITRMAFATVLLIGIWKDTESFWLVLFCLTLVILIELMFKQGKLQKDINKSFIDTNESLAKGMQSNHETISRIGKALGRIFENLKDK